VIPLFSVRARGGPVGEIPDLVPFAQWARRAGFSVVQILPVNEPAGGQASPYAARTAFALDPAYLALDAVEDHVALRAAAGGEGGGSVSWESVRSWKRGAVLAAFERFADRADGERRREFAEFARREADWLDDYALFVALHEEQGGGGWRDWPAPLAGREPGALAAARERLAASIEMCRYVQWQLDRQWRDARRRCAELGVELMGDLPFMVAGDSADVWARAGEFRLDARAGAPPDAFSADGQDWGLPVFRWDTIAAGDFAWMRERARRAAELYRYYRVDHVVGLYRTYFRPEGERTGQFTPAEEHEQLALGERVLGILDGGEARVVAEDLGIIPPFVRASLARLGIPGYRVLRWEKEGDRFGDPHEWPACSIATTGTHDTESLADWFDALPDWERAALRGVPGLVELGERWDERARDLLLRVVYQSGSDLVLIPFQDAIGARERVNVPGTVTGENWTYRMPEPAGAAALAVHALRLRALARESGRSD
jgi:4-alpha-glucanotransferase